MSFYRRNSNTGQQGFITLFSFFLTLHAVYSDPTLPHSYTLLDCNKQSKSNAATTNERPTMTAYQHTLERDDCFDCINF